MKFRKSLLLFLIVIMLFSTISACFAQDAQGAFKKGMKLFRDKKFRQAISSFDSALGSNKSFVKAYVFRGLSYFMLEDHLKAINDLNKALQMDPENVTALFGRGQAYLFIGKSKEAIVDFSSVLTKQPENALSHLQRGICYYRLGEYKKAVSDASKAISSNVKNIDPYILRGACYYRQKLYDATVTDFKRARDLRPDGPYLQLLYYVARAHSGNTSTDELRAFADKYKAKGNEFPYNLIKMMLGRRTAVECLKDVEKFKPAKLKGTILQQTQFFVSIFFFIQGDKTKAEKYEKLALNGVNKLFLIDALVKVQYYEFK